MVMLFGLVVTGFLAGVLLTSLIACYVFGCLHAEAVSVLDTGCLIRRSDMGGAAPEAGQLRSVA